MQIKAVWQILQELAPVETAASFDNCGLLVGGMEQSFTKIGLCLDVTPMVLAEAKYQQIDLLISHHPVIFHPLKAVSCDSMPYQLIQAGIACIAMHTNLDVAVGGVNDGVAQKVGLQNQTAPEALEGFGRLGEVAQHEVSALVDHLKQAFGASMIRYYDAGQPVNKVVTVAGSGGEFLEIAKALGADTLITGDLKHDRFVKAAELSMHLIELNHQDAEQTVLPWLSDQLKRHGLSVTVLDSMDIKTR